MLRQDEEEAVEEWCWESGLEWMLEIREWKKVDGWLVGGSL